MKTFVFNDKEIVVYNSIDELPIINFQKYNKYLLIDAGIGSDADSIDEHIIKIAKFINNGDKSKAIQELQNTRQNIHMVNNEISPKFMAFAALVYSINNKVIKDYSDDGLRKIINELNTVKCGQIANALAWLKKKVSTELETYYPENFSDAKEKEAFDKIKLKTQLQLDSIINDVDHTNEIYEIDAQLFGMYKPQTFIGSKSVEVLYDKQFESTCTIISQKTNLDAKKMTVLQFYNTLSDIKKQADIEAKAYSRNKKHH